MQQFQLKKQSTMQTKENRSICEPNSPSDPIVTTNIYGQLSLGWRSIIEVEGDYEQFNSPLSFLHPTSPENI